MTINLKEMNSSLWRQKSNWYKRNDFSSDA